MRADPDIRSLLLEWADAVRMGDPDGLLSLYAPDAVLLPTVSAHIRRSPEEIRDYFVKFLSHEPRCEIETAHAQFYEGTALCSGTYSFCLASGPVRTVPARFTFVYRWTAGRWLIVTHHSSALPERTAMGDGSSPGRPAT